MPEDIFVQNAPNSRDRLYLVFTLIITILILFNQLTSQSLSSFGAIYFPIIAFSLLIIITAIITHGRTLGEVIFGTLKNDEGLYKTIIIAVAVGLAIGFLIYQQNGILGFDHTFLPLAVAGGASSTTLLYLAVDTVVGPDIEENFISGGLVPTIASSLRNANIVALVGFFGGFVFLFLVPNAQIIASGFLAVGFIFLFSSLAKKQIVKSNVEKHIAAIIFGAVIFALFHSWAYASAPDPYSLLFTAAIFSVIVNILNWILQNTIGSRIVHSIVNASILTLQLNVSIYIAALGVILYILMIITVWKGITLKGKAIRGLSYVGS